MPKIAVNSHEHKERLDENTYFTVNFDNKGSVGNFKADIKGKLLQAQAAFKEHIKNNAYYPRSTLGLWNLHSDARANAIDHMIVKIDGSNKKQEVQGVIAEFFQSRDGRLNAHSLKTFVLDHLVTVNDGEHLAEVDFETREKVMQGLTVLMVKDGLTFESGASYRQIAEDAVAAVNNRAKNKPK